jgi:NAD(P)-dependent dehydrogenase (short-subunit alcohol dehydrogenase family)
MGNAALVGRLFNLSGKTAMVTGASSGLGVTFAMALAAAGAQVALAARRTERLSGVAAEIVAAGGKALPVACDVGDAEQVEAALKTAEEGLGRVDILVNNAGVVAESAIVPENVPHDLFEQTLRVNLLGTWYCCRAAGRRMLADGKGGSIINVSSIAGLGGVADFPTAYQASKSAVLNLTRNLACSWANRKVRVNALAPGWFPSEMTEDFFKMDGAREWVSKAAPMGRVGEPEELVGGLLFLASDASSFVTGQTLAIDGGISATISHSMPESISRILSENSPNGLGKRIGM